MEIYLISIESYHLINNEIKKIVKSNKYTTFNLNRITLKEVIDEANYYSLDNEKKYIVASNANFFGSEKICEQDTDLLIKYINNPNPNTILIFTSLEKMDARKKVSQAIKNKGKCIKFDKLDRKQISKVLTDYLTDFKYKIDYQTINYIIDNSYDNLDIMFNELDKIMLFYCNPCSIKYDDVRKIVGKMLDSNKFHFINSVIDKNLNLALKILKDLKVYKVETTSLVILLAREYRLMFYLKKMHATKSMQEIMRYLNLQDWQINKLYMNSTKFSERELLDNLIALSKIDTNIKKGIWDKDIALYGFLLEACS